MTKTLQKRTFRAYTRDIQLEIEKSSTRPIARTLLSGAGRQRNTIMPEFYHHTHEKSIMKYFKD